MFGIVDIVAIFSGLQLFFYLQLHPYMPNFNLSNFIKKGKIQRQGIKMENTENIMVNLNFRGKHHFFLLLAFFNLDGPSTLPKFNFYRTFNFLVFQPMSLERREKVTEF